MRKSLAFSLGYFSFLFLLSARAWSVGATENETLKIEKADTLYDLAGDNWRFIAGDNPAYAEAAFDDSAWKKLNINNEWRLQGVDYDGVAWFRKKLFIGEQFADKKIGLLVPTVSAAYELYINGMRLGGRGAIGAKGELQVVKEDVYLYQIPRRLLRAGEINSIAFRIRSIDSVGGIYGDLDFLIGEYEQLYWHHLRAQVIFGLLAGAFFIIGLYYAVLYFSSREQKAPLYFAGLAVFLGLFILGMKGMTHIFTGSYAFHLTCIHLPILTLPFWLLNFGFDFFEKPKTRMLKIVSFLSWFNVLLFSPVLVFPEKLLQLYLNSVFMLAFLMVAYALVYFLYITYKAVRERKGGALVVTTGILFYFGCTTNDMLSYLNVIHSVRLSDAGFLTLTFCMAVALAIQIARVYRDKEEAQRNALESQTLLADSYARFVPRQFLVNLGKESILDVKLGDQVQKQMAILFADIRSFTKLSESMTPAENFNFINSYLKRMTPIIQKHYGFIDKFLGDGIMALFENSTEDSLNAAIDMQKYMVEYNQHRSKQNYPPINIGVGVHTGNLMLGTIGSEGRMDGTVISDAVNLASRIEGLTKLYGIKIATSDETLGTLKIPQAYNYRFIDRVKVVGKDKPVGVIEVMDGDSAEQLEKKMATLPDFTEALAMYYRRDFDGARSLLSRVIGRNPEDKAAKLYYERCAYFKEHGLPPDWEGVQALDSK